MPAGSSKQRGLDNVVLEGSRRRHTNVMLLYMIVNINISEETCPKTTFFSCNWSSQRVVGGNTKTKVPTAIFLTNMSQVFREADPWHDPKRMHPTFRTKEYVVDQAVASNSHMESQPGVKSATVNDPKPALIPSKWDTAYDPQHPRADWSGSYRIEERAHYAGHRSMQTGISQEDNGFISKEEQPMWACKRRGQTQGLASTPGLIGGIGCSDPSETYRSVARRQAELDRTVSDQYTLAKRNVYAGGRKVITNPAQSREQSSRGGGRENRSNGGHGHGHVTFAGEDAADEEAYALYQASMQRQEEAVQVGRGGSSSSSSSIHENLAGYRAPAQTLSLTSGIASSLASSLNVSAIPRYVQQKDRKNLEADKPIPGYTGYRRNNLNL